MPQGRPKREEPTCVLAVRVPVALRLFLATQQPAGRLTPPQRVDEP